MEGLLYLDELGGSVQHVILVWRGEEVVARGRAQEDCVFGAVGLSMCVCVCVCNACTHEAPPIGVQ